MSRRIVGRWLVLGVLLCLPLVVLALGTRGGSAIAAEPLPDRPRMHGGINQQRDRYLLAQVVPDTTASCLSAAAAWVPSSEGAAAASRNGRIMGWDEFFAGAQNDTYEVCPQASS